MFDVVYYTTAHAFCSLSACLQLLEDPEAKVDAKRKRKDVLRQFSFAETFGSKSGQRQKRPRISAEAYEELVAHAEVHPPPHSHRPLHGRMMHRTHGIRRTTQHIARALMQRSLVSTPTVLSRVLAAQEFWWCMFRTMSPAPGLLT